MLFNQLIFAGKNLNPTIKNDLYLQKYAVSTTIVVQVIYYSAVLSEYAKISWGSVESELMEIRITDSAFSRIICFKYSLLSSYSALYYDFPFVRNHFLQTQLFLYHHLDCIHDNLQPLHCDDLLTLSV